MRRPVMLIDETPVEVHVYGESRELPKFAVDFIEGLLDERQRMRKET